LLAAVTYDEIISQLESGFQSRYPPTESSVRMVGLLFARPESPLSREEISPQLSYFHHRAGRNIDFFCAGYAEKGSERWGFDVRKFNQLREEVERRSGWRYGGGPELILANARYDVERHEAEIDFGSALKVTLDRAKQDGAIASVETFFEQIFQFAEQQSGEDPTWGFAIQAGLRRGSEGILAGVLSLLPGRFGREAKATSHFIVADLRA
jgi:hypothetical protein